MRRTDVLFALTGDARRNSRALRQLRVIAGLGLEVDVLSFGPEPGVEVLDDRLTVHTLASPPGRGVPFFRGVHRLFRDEAIRRPAAVYHASDLYVLPALAAAADRHGARLVYDARELYTRVASTTGRPWVRAAWRLVEGRHIGRADLVLTVSDGIAERLARMYGIEPPTVIHNVPAFAGPVRPAAEGLRARTGLARDAVLFLHQGQMRTDRGCTRLVDALQDVPGAALVFLGDGPLKPELQSLVERLRLGDRVRFLDAVPPDDLLPVTAGADVGVTLLEDSCLNHRYALPNKLFEYLAAGLPVLASDLPEIRRVVDGFDVGCVVDPGDRPALVEALRRMTTDAPARARWAGRSPRVFETFDWASASELLAGRYLDLIHTAVAP